MEHLMSILTLFSATAAGSLVGAIWEGTVLAASVALCLHFVKGIPAGVRSILWTAVLLLVVLMHFIPFFGARSSAAHAAPGGMLHVDLRWSLAIVCFWGVFSVVRGSQLISSAMGLRRVAKRATPVAASPVVGELLRTRFRTARLCTSADVDRPSVIGFFAPRVLIPQTLFEKLSASELEQIVMHEMEHLRRADDWTNLLQKVSLVLFPLNPVLLWVERRLCVERELACDDRVLQLTRARKAYASSLVNLAEHSVLRRGASLVLGAWERQSELGQRVRRILRQPEGVMGRRQMKIVTSALVLGMICGAATLAREPQLVSFAPLPPTHMDAEVMPEANFVPTSYRVATGSPKMVQTVFHESAVHESGSTEPGSTPTAVPKKPRRHKSPHLTSTTGSVPNAVTLHAVQRGTVQRIAQQPRAWIVLTDWT